MTGTFWPLNAAGRLLAGYQTTIWRNFPPNNSGNQCRWKCGLPKLMWAISSINQFELNFLATPCHSAWKTVMVCDKCRWHSGQPKVGLKPIWLWSAQLSNVTYCECVLWTESNKRYGRCHCNWTPQHRSNEWAVFFFRRKRMSKIGTFDWEKIILFLFGSCTDAAREKYDCGVQCFLWCGKLRGFLVDPTIRMRCLLWNRRTVGITDCLPFRLQQVTNSIWM